MPIQVSGIASLNVTDTVDRVLQPIQVTLYAITSVGTSDGGDISSVSVSVTGSLALSVPYSNEARDRAVGYIWNRKTTTPYNIAYPIPSGTSSAKLLVISTLWTGTFRADAAPSSTYPSSTTPLADKPDRATVSLQLNGNSFQFTSPTVSEANDIATIQANDNALVWVTYLEDAKDRTSASLSAVTAISISAIDKKDTANLQQQTRQIRLATVDKKDNSGVQINSFTPLLVGAFENASDIVDIAIYADWAAIQSLSPEIWEKVP